MGGEEKITPGHHTRTVPYSLLKVPDNLTITPHMNAFNFCLLSLSKMENSRRKPYFSNSCFTQWFFLCARSRLYNVGIREL